MNKKIDWKFDTEEIEKIELSSIIYKLLDGFSPEEFVRFHQYWMKDHYLAWNDSYSDSIKRFTKIDVRSDEGEYKIRELFDDSDFWDLSSEKYIEFLEMKSFEDAIFWLNGDYDDFWNERKLNYLLKGEESNLTEDEAEDIMEVFHELCGEYFSGWAFRHMLLDLLERNEGYFKRLKKQSKKDEIEFVI